MKKIIAIGTKNPENHPLSNIYTLKELLNGYNLSFNENHDDFLKTSDFDMVISYVDAWENPLLDSHIDAIQRYIQNGGRMLVFHNGISMNDKSQINEIIGGRFTGHPDSFNLIVEIVKNHSVTNGISDFTVFDEPYQFEINDDINFFAQYEINGKKIPAAWEKRCGEGTVVYLMPGHDSSVFENEMYKKMIKNAIEYLCQ